MNLIGPVGYASDITFGVKIDCINFELTSDTPAETLMEMMKSAACWLSIPHKTSSILQLLVWKIGGPNGPQLIGHREVRAKPIREVLLISTINSVSRISRITSPTFEHRMATPDECG